MMEGIKIVFKRFGGFHVTARRVSKGRLLQDEWT